MKLWWRKNLTDKALAPYRAQLRRNFPPVAESLLEVGCATGQLLFDNQEQFKTLVGIDLDAKYISAAEANRKQFGFNHISFINQDACAYLNDIDSKFDVAVASLCLHAMPLQQALDTLKAMCAKAKWVVVMDFIEPESKWGQFKLNLDEWFAGHLDKYLDYRDAGGMDAMIDAAGQAYCHFEQMPKDDSVGIWLIKSE